VGNLDPSKLWYPSPSLPFIRSSHPFDVSCSSIDLRRLPYLTSLPPSTIISFVKSLPLENLQVRDLRNLLSPQSPINQQVINLYVSLLCHQCSLKCLDSSFYSTLKDKGWHHVSRWFSNPSSMRRRRQSTPSLVGEPAILIPCHVNGCHWVAVTRREIQGRVIFLYADDMNSPSTEKVVLQTLSTSNHDFYPSSTLWITCKNTTYLPHSNERGIRTLLALTIQAMHPNPSNTILTPIMHPNLAQIGRAWIALSIINGVIPVRPVHWALKEMGYHSCPQNQQSVPSAIIPWLAPALAESETSKKPNTHIAPSWKLQKPKFLNPNVSKLVPSVTCPLIDRLHQPINLMPTNEKTFIPTTNQDTITSRPVDSPTIIVTKSNSSLPYKNTQPYHIYHRHYVSTKSKQPPPVIGTNHASIANRNKSTLSYSTIAAQFNGASQTKYTTDQPRNLPHSLGSTTSQTLFKTSNQQAGTNSAIVAYSNGALKPHPLQNQYYADSNPKLVPFQEKKDSNQISEPHVDGSNYKALTTPPTHGYIIKKPNSSQPTLKIRIRWQFI
jgi:hypothetical protein